MPQPKQTSQTGLCAREARSLVGFDAALSQLLDAEDSGPATETGCGDEEDNEECGNEMGMPC